MVFDVILFFKVFSANMKTFALNPIVLAIFILFSVVFIFLQIANTLFKRKNDTDFKLSMFVDLPKIFIRSMLCALFFIACFCIMAFTRDASQKTYDQLNVYLASGFTVKQKVDGSFMTDYELRPIKTKEGKEKFKKAFLSVYKDKVLTFADMDYLASINDKIIKNEDKR